MSKNPTITLEQLYGRIRDISEVKDRLVTSDDMFQLVGVGETTKIAMSGLEITPTVAYQVKAAGGEHGLDTTDIKGRLRRARGSNEQRAALARGELKVMVSGLNKALRARDLKSSPLTMRLGKDDLNRQFVGGVVTTQYAPLTHLEFVQRMLEHPGFQGAKVHKYTVNPSRLEFAMLLEGHEWDTDGGLKSGLFGGNGQFGDKSANLYAMLFRLLCTNGMMDVADKTGMRRRHAGNAFDLTAELARVLKSAEELFGLSVQSMEVECDVVDLLTEAYRRGHLNRGQFKKTLERRDEVMGGQQVQGAVTTLWGASQAITAAARDYGLGSDRRMGEFAGRLVRAGGNYGNVLQLKPIKRDVTDHEDILAEFGIAA